MEQLPLATVNDDMCAACCREPEPSAASLNSVVASRLYTLSLDVIKRGGVPGCDTQKAEYLKQWTHQFLAKPESHTESLHTRTRNLPCFYLGTQTGTRSCTTGNGEVRVKVFNCTHDSHGEVTIRTCMSCHDYDERLEVGCVRSWAVGITTAPRGRATLRQTLKSLAIAGWSDPHLFAEPGTQLPSEAADLSVTWRPRALGPWPNWLLALMELAMQDPHADAYLMCQDDVLLARGLRDYLEQTLWPDHRLGVVSLYCPSHYSKAERGYHTHDGCWDTWGALAYVFPNAAVRALLRHSPVINHRHRGPDEGRRHVDCVVGRWCRESGLGYYLHTPSLAQHIGDDSTIFASSTATGRRVADDFVGDDVDIREAMSLSARPRSNGRHAHATPTLHPNDFFDHIYCINLERRADRWQWMQSQLRRWGIKAERFPAADGSDPSLGAEYQSLLDNTIPFIQARNAYQIPNAGAYGCLVSHTRVIEDAKAKGYERILVLEDDACFHRDFMQQFQVCTRLPQDWRMLYLGALQWRHWKELEHHDHGLYYAQETLGAHAVGLHCSLFDELLALYRTRESMNDEWLTELQHQYAGRCFVCLPNLVIQDTRTSDNRTPRPQRRYAARVQWDLDLYDLPQPPENLPVRIEERRVMTQAVIGDTLIRGTPIRTGTELAAVCCYFNPCRYRSRYRNYLRFAAGLDERNVPLLTIELAYGDAPSELNDLPGVMRLRTKDVMWQKERLLQIAVEHVADRGIEKVAWLDADIIFDDPDWLAQAGRKLEEVPVCQLYNSVRQDPAFVARGQQQGAVARYRSIGAMAGGAPGYAWAARTALLQEVGLYDRCIIGGGDTAFLLGCLCSSAQPRWAQMLSEQPFWRFSSGAFRQHYTRWAMRLGGLVRGQIGFLDGAIQTLYHGTAEDRDYQHRYRWLRHFDPARDIELDESGCWKWATDRPDMHEGLRRYFASRREDE